jgi:hypothetical protein
MVARDAEELAKLKTDIARLEQQCAASSAENMRLRALLRATTAISNRRVTNPTEAVQRGHIKPGELEAAMDAVRCHFMEIEGTR